MVGQVGLGPGRDESGDAASVARFADVVVDPVERDERLGVAGGGEHPAGLAGRHDLVVWGVQDEQGDGVSTVAVRGAGEPTVTTARTPGSVAAAARTAGPAAE